MGKTGATVYSSFVLKNLVYFAMRSCKADNEVVKKAYKPSMNSLFISIKDSFLKLIIALLKLLV